MSKSTLSPKGRKVLSRKARNQFRIGGKFARKVEAAPVAPAPVAVPHFDAARHVNELKTAIMGGDLSVVQRKVRGFCKHVKGTTPLEELVLAMLNEWAS